MVDIQELYKPQREAIINSFQRRIAKNIQQVEITRIDKDPTFRVKKLYHLEVMALANGSGTIYWDMSPVEMDQYALNPTPRCTLRAFTVLDNGHILAYVEQYKLEIVGEAEE